jgi:SAM-dependent methyltransferase
LRERSYDPDFVRRRYVRAGVRLVDAGHGAGWKPLATAQERANARCLDTLDANLYALTHRGNPGDVEHYTRLCHDASSVLELGSGYGRMLQALARPKRTLVGLELDPSLLRLGRKTVEALPASWRQNVTIVHGDMQRIELGRRFERVLLPYNALYCLLSRSAAERCLRSVRAALEPGGLFAFDVWNADRLRDDDLAPDQDEEELARFEHAGRTWSVFERCRRARTPQRLDVTYRYVPSGRAAPRSQVVRQRYYRSNELQALLEQSGFVVQTKLGSFGGGRFNERATRLIVTARALE